MELHIRHRKVDCFAPGASVIIGIIKSSRGEKPHICRPPLPLERVCMFRFLVDQHGVVAVQRRSLRLDRDDAPPPAGQELSPDFRADLVVSVGEQEVQQDLPLIFGDLVPVPLRERQQGLVPDDGELRLRRRPLARQRRHIHRISLPHGGGIHAAEA